MSHYIVHGTKFENACQQLLTKDFTLSWMDRFPVEDEMGQLFLLPLNAPMPEINTPDDSEMFLNDLAKQGLHVPEVIRILSQKLPLTSLIE